MRDWSGTDLRDFTSIPKEAIHDLVDELRAWSDRTVPDLHREIEPTKKQHAIRTVDELAVASRGRRDSCFKMLTLWLFMVNGQEFDPKISARFGKARANRAKLFARFIPVVPFRDGASSLLRPFASNPKKGLVYTFDWKDDGKDYLTDTVFTGVGLPGIPIVNLVLTTTTRYEVPERGEDFDIEKPSAHWHGFGP